MTSFGMQSAITAARARQPFDATAQAYAVTPVRQPGGAYVNTWAAVGTPSRARLSPISADEPLVLGRPTARARWYLVLPWDRNIEDDQRVVVRRDDGVLLTYAAVVGRRSPRSYQIITKLIVESVDEELPDGA